MPFPRQVGTGEHPDESGEASPTRKRFMHAPQLSQERIRKSQNKQNLLQLFSHFTNRQPDASASSAVRPL